MFKKLKRTNNPTDWGPVGAWPIGPTMRWSYERVVRRFVGLTPHLISHKFGRGIFACKNAYMGVFSDKENEYIEGKVFQNLHDIHFY